MEFKTTPMMTAPNRSKPVIKHSPTIPTSLKRQAEGVVVQRAKDLVTRHPDIEDFAPLKEAVEVLKKLEG